MADLLCLFSVLLLLLLPVSCSQSTLHTHRDVAALPPPAPAPQRNQDAGNLNPKLTHGHVDQDNAKVGIFMAAAVGTCTLMAVVYCIYNKFYSKQPYLHTQLQEEPDPLGSPSVYFQASSEADVRRAGYGSLSDTPSVISVPPYLSPPPSAMPFPPLFASASSASRSPSRSLRTISAKDLQRSCI
ncbi:uncharacterized protein LOC144038459 [Vanacampus margaritifer]